MKIYKEKVLEPAAAASCCYSAGSSELCHSTVTKGTASAG